ncbi:hypothetical protein ABI59_23915 [Acidobacteria bacterium Mor1]|nr:hypothetical protein ABI59_23915 [Acidobacteria bacterium Mor1]
MPIAREAFPFILIALLVTVVPGFFLPWLAVPGALFLLFTLWFFRDPERTPPDDVHAFVSPADGKVIEAGPDRISIFLNVFNVHVCRTPVAGTVTKVTHHPGQFLAAWDPKAAECNERVVVDVDAPRGAMRFAMVAGLVARRIVPKVSEGQTLQAGQRVGLIRFGSRADIHPPAGTRISVEVGQKVVAGETVLGVLPEGGAE